MYRTLIAAGLDSKEWEPMSGLLEMFSSRPASEPLLDALCRFKVHHWLARCDTAAVLPRERQRSQNSL
jgi:hypothetical protein